MGLKSPSSDKTQLEVWDTFNLTCASVQWHRSIFPLTLDWYFFNGVSVAQFLQIILNYGSVDKICACLIAANHRDTPQAWGMCLSTASDLETGLKLGLRVK